MKVRFLKGSNRKTSFTKGQEDQSYKYFSPIDAIYGDFNQNSRRRVKSDFYLPFFTNGHQKNFSKIDFAEKTVYVAFSIHADHGTTHQYKLGVRAFDTSDKEHIKESLLATETDAIEVIVTELATIKENANYASEMFFRIGKKANESFVLFYHGANETHTPGKIPGD